jgi:hypothetical protein
MSTSEGNPKFPNYPNLNVSKLDRTTRATISDSEFHISNFPGVSHSVFRICSVVCLGVILLIASDRAVAQQKDFEIRAADVLNVRRIGTQQIQALVGRVHMIQPSPSGDVKIWCDSAFRNMKTNVVDLYGHVKIVRDSVTLTSTEGTYSGNDRKAVMPTDIRLTRGSMVLTSKYGEYWEIGRAHV